MKRLIIYILLTTIALPAVAQISDQQIVEQARRMKAQGLEAEQIGLMLMQGGATEAQIMRIKSSLETETAIEELTGVSAGQSVIVEQSRMRTDSVIARDTVAAPIVKSKIFGHDIFNNKNLTFAPQVNMATPENYILGAGDEVIIDIWGHSQQTVRATISPDGIITAPHVGQVHLAGLSVAAASERLKAAFGKVYDFSSGTNFNLSISEIRTIQVHVMGEVAVPGTYTVSSLATLFNVLYNAGGVTDIGSLRDIRVNRGGKEVAKVDVYGYLLEGRSDMDVALKDGDVVVVQPYTNLVAVTGKVKRPMTYEAADGETLQTLLRYAGGFAGDAYTKSVRVIRRSGREYRVYNVDNFAEFAMNDLDSVSVDALLQRFENRIEVRGAVFRPGVYALDKEVETVGALVKKAEGLRGDVFGGRAVLYRLKEDYTSEALAVDVVGILSGNVPDVALRKDDILEIPSIFDLQEGRTVAISGAVGMPGSYPWAEGMTLEDLVLKAGGLLESASTVRVDVVQRIKDPESTLETRVKAVHLSFALKDGLTVEGDAGYNLRPFDAVYVRNSPAYSVQKNVSIGGQVLFGGEYAITESGERLSELVARAGGVTQDAYIQGARLIRKKSEQERARDSLGTSGISLRERYPVAIELDKALENPGSDHDVVLREGDQLYVPDYLGTVTVTGAVIYPNTVAYKKGADVRSYIGQGGGFAKRALKRKTYVIHMNGTVDDSRFAKVTPGSIVVVPHKGVPRMTAGEVVGLATSTASLGALILSLISLL